MRRRQRKPAFRFQCPVLRFKGSLITINQILQGACFQAPGLDLFFQGPRDVMFAHFAHFNFGNCIPPPLEPDQAKTLFRNHQAHPCQLVCQRIKCRQRLSLIVLRIAAGNPAVFVCPQNPLVDCGPLRFGKRASLV